MPDFSLLIPDTHVKVSSGFTDALIQSQREELLTGLMRLQYPSGENLVFTFLEGVQQKLYRCIEKNMEVIPRQSWSHVLDRPDASIAFLTLTVEGMRLMRVAYEAPIIEMERLNCRGDQLVEQTRLWASDSSAAILHVQAEMFNKIYLLAGNPFHFIAELSLNGNEARFSLSDASLPKLFSQANYVVTRYCSESKHDVWQEYTLRFAFDDLISALLNRFGELAGRVLTERLCEQLTLWLRDGGWNINMTLRGVANQHYFESLEEAKRAYLEIIRRFNYEVSPAIGSHMAEGMVRDSLSKMDAHYQELLQRHIFDAGGVGNSAAGPGR